jgi:hypothetical protein
MKTWIITLAADQGIIRVKVTAKTLARAIVMLMQAESCPSCAVLNAELT